MWDEKERLAQLQIDEFAAALALFRFDLGRYPSEQEGLQVLITPPGEGAWKGPYLSREQLPSDPWGGEYCYRLLDDYPIVLSSRQLAALERQRRED